MEAITKTIKLICYASNTSQTKQPTQLSLTFLRLPVAQLFPSRPLLLMRRCCRRRRRCRRGRLHASHGRAAPLTIRPLKRTLHGLIEVQRILAFAEQLHHRLAVHQRVQTLRADVDVDVRRLQAVDKQRDPIAGEAERQRAQRGRLVHADDGKVLGMRVRIGGNVECDFRLFAIEEEAELVLERGEVDHEEGLDGDLELSPRSVFARCVRLQKVSVMIHMLLVHSGGNWMVNLETGNLCVTDQMHMTNILIFWFRSRDDATSLNSCGNVKNRTSVRGLCQAQLSDFQLESVIALQKLRHAVNAINNII